MTAPPYIAPTCHDLAWSVRGGSGDTHQHTAALDCDLRVVGMSDYRIRRTP